MNQGSMDPSNSLDASLIMQQRGPGAIPRGNTPQRRNIKQLAGDQISEIDMNSDARSMQSAQMGYQKLPLKQNNLMGTGNDFAQQNKFNSSLNEKGWDGTSQFSDSRGMLDAQSNFGGSAQGSNNMFHPRARETQQSAMDAQKEKLKEAARLKELEKKKIAEEWGFQNPASMAIWEARQRKKNAGKKKHIKLTADQKLAEFKKIAGKK